MVSLRWTTVEYARSLISTQTTSRTRWTLLQRLFQRLSHSTSLPWQLILWQLDQKATTKWLPLPKELHKINQPPVEWQQDHTFQYWFLDLDGVTKAQRAVEIMRKVLVVNDGRGNIKGQIVTGAIKARLDREEQEFKNELERRSTYRDNEESPWSQGMDEYQKSMLSPRASARGRSAMGL